MKTNKEALEKIVGSQNLIDNPAVLDSYAADESYAPKRRPWFVVRPHSAAEVEKLVAWANQTGTPFIPVSSGPPHFHGDTVPSCPEGVIVDLSGMKEIKRIDRRNKIAVIEPGVTYAELEPALAKEGLRISRPLLPRPNKSVMASLLERQPTTIPRFNYSLPEPLRTCGVVWGSGEVAFTGEAGNGPMDLEAQWARRVAQVDPRGPNATDLMRLLTGAQGTMGIVIWASVKCELIAEAHRYVFAPAQKLEDLVEFCYQAERIRIGDEVMVLNAAQLAAMVGKTEAEASALRERLPAWALVIGLAGAGYFSAERVQVQELDLKRLAQKCGRTLVDALDGASIEELANAVERSSGQTYYKLRAKGACQEIFFLTTLDKAPGFAETVFAIADRRRYPASEIGVYIQPQHQGVSQHVEFSFPFDPAEGREAEKVRGIYSEASEALIAQGAYFSRPYGEWAEMVYKRNADATRILRAVKQIVDPKNVLNPGKLCF